MKSIIIKNLMVQFDSFDAGADKHNALNMIESINEVLKERFPDEQPTFFVSAIDDDDIEISDEEDE